MKIYKCGKSSGMPLEIVTVRDEVIHLITGEQLTVKVFSSKNKVERFKSAKSLIGWTSSLVPPV